MDFVENLEIAHVVRGEGGYVICAIVMYYIC